MKSRTATLSLLLAALATAVGLLLASCNVGQVPALDREELFRLSIGRAEDQIDLFQLDASSGIHKNRLVMRDGIFFISNGSANKIMEFSSFGDLLSLHFDPDENPRPVLLQTTAVEGRITNRRAHPYHFSRVGEVAVTSDRTLLVEDMLGEERALFDGDLGVNLNRVILRFSSRGQLIDYLGQEGIGGTPFPYVEMLQVTANDEIVVVSRTLSSRLVFWFSPGGSLRYTVEIPLDRLPVPQDRTVIPVLESIFPDMELPRLYLKLDYYEQAVDDETGSGIGIEKALSRVIWLDLSTGRYEGYVNLPVNAQTVGGHSVFERRRIEFMYQMVGTAPGQHLFFLSREDNDQTQLLIMRTDGRVVRRRNLSIEDSELITKSFHVSDTGVLSALLGFEDHARLVWWRSDRLIGEQRR